MKSEHQFLSGRMNAAKRSWYLHTTCMHHCAAKLVHLLQGAIFPRVSQLFPFTEASSSVRVDHVGSCSKNTPKGEIFGEGKGIHMGWAPLCIPKKVAKHVGTGPRPGLKCFASRFPHVKKMEQEKMIVVIDTVAIANTITTIAITTTRIAV